jgi:hypothetical protein
MSLEIEQAVKSKCGQVWFKATPPRSLLNGCHPRFVNACFAD